jgi:PTH1 family peptidyl-tRNA hydrolase
MRVTRWRGRLRRKAANAQLAHVEPSVAVRLLVGLGNPGRRYVSTRHSVGFRVVDRLAERHRIPLVEERFEGRFGTGRVGDREVALLEPLTWMNASGRSVAEAVRRLALDPADALVVAYDDVDLPLGRLRLRPSGSSGGHGGLTDVIECLGRQDFARLRFGIGRPESPDVGTTDFVLGRFSADEERVVGPAVERAADALETWLREGVVVAMNRFNA